MQTIREAKIVIHLEQGNAELKVPDLSKVLADQQKQIDLSKQLEEQLKRVESAQRAANSGGSSGGGSSGSGSSRLSYEEREHRKILAVMEEEEQAIARLRSSMSALAGAAGNAAEGFFRLARAAVLLGASDESLQQMIKSLAEVQAYWDLFAGTLKIIQAVTAAQKALAAAQASYVAALAASTLATQVFTVALVEALAALLAFLAPFIVIGAVIGGVIIAAIALWDALTVSEEEATEAAKAYNDEVIKQTQEAIDLLDRRMELERDLEVAKRSQMSLAEQQASLAGSRGTAAGVAVNLRELADIAGPGREQELEAARQYALEANKLANEEIELAMRRRDAEIEVAKAKIDQIEAAEKNLATAERQLQIEQDKLRSFQAQVGALSQLEQQQLIQIRDKLRAGQGLNQFEEDFLAQNGGEGGRKAVEDIRAKRGAAAGFGVDFWDGTAGAGAAKDMADASDKVAKALEELAKLLGDAGSAAEAKARYEAQIKTIEESSAKQVEVIKEAWAENIKVLEDITEQLKELQMAAITG